MGEAKGPEMFRDLTVGELQMLFAVLGEGAFADAGATSSGPRSGKSRRMFTGP
jgi:hypothetical protein